MPLGFSLPSILAFMSTSFFLLQFECRQLVFFVCYESQIHAFVPVSALEQSCFTKFRFHFTVPFPDFKDRRIDDQLKDERCEDSADHWGGNPLHDVCSGARGPHDGHEPEEHACHGHHLGPQALHGTVDDRFPQIVPTTHLTFLERFVVCQIEVEQHKHGRLCVHAKQGDQTHPHRNAHVVAQKIKEPDGSHRRERHGQEDDHGFRKRLRIKVEQKKNDEQSD